METMKRIIKRLKEPVSNEKGMVSLYGIFLLTVIVTVIFLVVIAYGVRLFSSQSIITEVHEAMNKVVTSAVTMNSDETYSSKREAYTGAYEAKTHDEILELLSEDKVIEKLTEMLNLNTPEGKMLGKYESTAEGYKTIYYISDIQLVLTNPNLTKNDEYVKAEIYVTLHIPFQLGSFVNKANEIELVVTSTAIDVPKY